MTIAEIIKELKKNSDPADREGMRRFGIDPKYALGVRVPVLRGLAKKIGRNHSIALALWRTKIHEARILACMVDEPEKCSEKQMDSWIKDFNSWDLCDQCCMNLFDKFPFAFEKAAKLTADEEEFTRRAGFALMACLAVHDKKAANNDFREFFPYIVRYAEDNRNFVKKAVNWALRQIGKRNRALGKDAIRVAEEILRKYPDSTAARWIARDAIRELKQKQED
jgi:3-methyladenine DNA glycosylase AlkD